MFTTSPRRHFSVILFMLPAFVYPERLQYILIYAKKSYNQFVHSLLDGI